MKKSINVKVDERILDDLRTVQAYYSSKLGVSFNQAETLSKLINESANLIKNVGETYPGRDWTFEKKENDLHTEFEERSKRV